MRLPLQKILSNVRGLLVAFSLKAPRFHPVFFLLSFFFAGAASKKKRFSSEGRIKKQSRFRQLGTGTAFNHQDGY
jgi:hypothetical protein